MGKRRGGSTRAAKPSRELTDEELDGASGGNSGIGPRTGGATGSPDDVMASFLKLGVNNPADDPGAHEALHNASKDLIETGQSESGRKSGRRP
jgi:hypothetical protein